MFARLKREIVGVIDEIIELAYFMRGAIPYEEMMNRSPGERERISKFVSRRLKEESKHMYPNY